MKDTVTRIWNFYSEGFRSMTLGRTLWLIILLKLFIMFGILKLFFFPGFLKKRPEGVSKEEFVATELLERPNILVDDNH